MNYISIFLGLVLLTGIPAGQAGAETGVTDSPLFSLDMVTITGVDPAGEINPPVSGLVACYPNPFNPSTTIEYRLAGAAQVDLAVYDLKGRLVRTLVAGMNRPAGAQKSVWRGRDDSGRTVAGGVYVCRLEIDGHVFNRRLTLIK